LKVRIPLNNRPNQERLATFLCVVKSPFCIFSTNSSQIKLQTHVHPSIDIHRLAPTCLTEKFDTAQKQYSLRNLDFHIPHFHTVHYGKHSLQYFEPHLWNELDHSEREKPNVKSFNNSSNSKDLTDLQQIIVTNVT